MLYKLPSCFCDAEPWRSEVVVPFPSWNSRFLGFEGRNFGIQVQAFHFHTELEEDFHFYFSELNKQLWNWAGQFQFLAQFSNSSWLQTSPASSFEMFPLYPELLEE